MNKTKTFIAISFVIFLIYSNTFYAAWHLDDYANILDDPRIHIDNLGLDTIWGAVSAFSVQVRDARPLARLTFAVNWYLGQDSPFLYHVVNIGAHVLSAFFLFVTTSLLFRTPRMQGLYSRREICLMSLLAALLWAANPIQTQAVTYIVQRMAVFAALFYLMSLYWYLKARLADSLFQRVLLSSGCVISFGLALASKENAATLPLALVLLEAIFFQDLRQRRTRRIVAGTAGAIVAVVSIMGVYALSSGEPLNLFSYQFRYFSPLERLMTEARVVLFYLSQIFLPAPARLSIEHDVAISTSLIQPWTTLPSIAIIILLIGFAFASLRTRPILSYAILFFFLNHAIESSIIGLELVFEHRNYLPSLFLFVPIAVGTVNLLNRYQNTQAQMYRTLVIATFLVIFGLGTGTYIRNFAWQSERSLWEDALSKALRSSRPWHNLGLSYYQKTGQPDKAMAMFHKALTLEKKNVHQQSQILNNIAANYYYRGDFEKAAESWEQASLANPRNMKTVYYRALALTKLGNPSGALVILDQVLSQHPRQFEPLNLKGLILLNQGKCELALSYFKICLEERSNQTVALINTGAAFNLLADYRRADLYLKTCYGSQPQNLINLLWLIRNALQQDHMSFAEQYAQSLLAIYSSPVLLADLSAISGNPFYADSVVAPVVDEQFLAKIKAKVEQQASRSISHTPAVAGK